MSRAQPCLGQDRSNIASKVGVCFIEQIRDMGISNMVVTGEVLEGQLMASLTACRAGPGGHIHQTHTGHTGRHTGQNRA